MRVFLLLSLLMVGCGTEYDPQHLNGHKEAKPAAPLASPTDSIPALRADVRALQEANAVLTSDMVELKTQLQEMQFQLQGALQAAREAASR